MGDDRTKDRGKKAVSRRSFDPYDSLPAGSGTPHMTSKGVIELFRKALRRTESEQFRDREKRIKFEVLEDGRKPVNKQRGFDPYNSDG